MPEQSTGTRDIHVEPGIAGRFFLVGCARSGTTLLQAMLARHSRVFSPPETHFFWRAQASRLRRWLGIAGPRAGPTLRDLLRELDREDLGSMVPGQSPLLRSYASAFCEILDNVTQQQGKDIWVEKTPLHLTRLATISRYVRGGRFIHIVRDGRDVVASLCDVASQGPGVWGERSIEQCIQRWNRDLSISLAHSQDPRHRLVIYERLLVDPHAELTALCCWLDLAFEAEMLHHWVGVERVLGRLAVKPWMQKPFEPLHDTRGRKFRQIFSASERRFIEDNLMFGGQVDGLRPQFE